MKNTEPANNRKFNLKKWFKRLLKNRKKSTVLSEKVPIFNEYGQPRAINHQHISEYG